MAKQHTSVSLPGGIAGLVHAAQQPVSPSTASSSASSSTTPAAEADGQAAVAPSSGAPSSATTPDRAAKAPTTAAEYRAARAAGQTQWQLFRAMGREYHRTANLGAVYIDRRLKQQLGQLRASSLGLSTSAILSSIVAQFLMEHEADIDQVLHE